MDDTDIIDVPGGWGRIRRCRHGLFLYNRNDSIIGRSLKVYGEYSEREVGLLRSLLRPGDCFVDAGANIGTLTVPMARKVGPSGIGYAFEPQRLNFQLLCTNLALNGITHIRARNAALAENAGELSVPLYDPGQQGNYGDVRATAAGAPTAVGTGCESVPVTTIDALALQRCRLIKIDVQGMESAVLAGAEETIQRCQPALLVENEDRDVSPSLIRRIRAMGYRLWWHRPMLFDENNYRGCQQNLFGTAGSFNMLCLPTSQRSVPELPEILGDDDWETHSP